MTPDEPTARELKQHLIVDKGVLAVSPKMAELAPGERTTIALSLVALRPGPHRVPPVRLVCEEDGVTVAELAGAVAVAEAAG